mmetsp:Transcript_40931/g.112517  ORF Transcript_40931/g.112517 Transcript_40931/m.112517 type:complete len:211 (+) Transcript_40931:527-1159(+)
MPRTRSQSSTKLSLPFSSRQPKPSRHESNMEPYLATRYFFKPSKSCAAGSLFMKSLLSRARLLRCTRESSCFHSVARFGRAALLFTMPPRPFLPPSEVLLLALTFFGARASRFDFGSPFSMHGTDRPRPAAILWAQGSPDLRAENAVGSTSVKVTMSYGISNWRVLNKYSALAGSAYPSASHTFRKSARGNCVHPGVRAVTCCHQCSVLP